MKKLFLLFAAASFLFFSCVSVQERPETDNADNIEDIEEEASTQAASSTEENDAAHELPSDAQAKGDETSSGERTESALADAAESAQEDIAKSEEQDKIEEESAVEVIAADSAEPSSAPRASRANPETQRRPQAQRPPQERRQAPQRERQPRPAQRPQPPAPPRTERSMERSAPPRRAPVPPPAVAAEERKGAALPDTSESAKVDSLAATAKPETLREEELPRVAQAPSEAPSTEASEQPAQPAAEQAAQPAAEQPSQPVQPVAEQPARPQRRLERATERAQPQPPAPAPSPAPRGRVAAEELMPTAPAATSNQAEADEVELFTDSLPSVSEAPVGEAADVQEEPLPEPSRTVYLAAGQSLEVWYPGRGWSFDGFRESEKPSGMTFSSRRFEDGDTLFFFRSSKPGTFVLEFSRFDIPTGRYIEDSLAVAVSPQGALPSDAQQSVVRPGVVRAPDYEGLGTVAAKHSAKDEPAAPAIEEKADAVTLAATEERAEREAESDRSSTAPAAELRPNAAPEPAPAPVAESTPTPAPAATAERRQNAAPALVAEPAPTPAPEPAPAVAEDFDDDVANEPSVMVAPAARAVARAESASAASEQVSSIEETSENASISAQASQPQSSAEGSVSLSDIRAMIDAGDIDGATLGLDRFFAESATDTDEALFLQGQAYEANSPRRDMRRALSAYETLTQAYPLSRFWEDADRRIRYIRRFYFDMR